MRLAGTNPPFTIDRCQHLSAAEQLALLTNAMDDQALHRTLNINDLELHAIADDPAGVGILAARFRIERRLLQHNLDEVALLGSLGKRPVHDDATNLRLRGELGVPGEWSRSERPQLPVDLHRLSAGLLGLGVGLGTVLLLLHQPSEACLVDAQPLLGRHLQGEIDRETVRVVQLERAVAAEHRLMLPLGVGDREIKDLSTRGEVRRNASSSAYAIWEMRAQSKRPRGRTQPSSPG